MPDPLVVADGQGRIVLVNGHAERLFGYQREDLIGLSIDTLIPERFGDHHPALRDSYFEARRPRSPAAQPGIQLSGLRRDLSEFTAEVTLSPLETEGGLLVITAIRETHASNKIDEERQRLVQAQEAVRMRDEFLSIAAHELRTPLTALQLHLDGLAQTLRGIEPADRAPYARVQLRAEKASRTTARLTDLVNRLLDLSRIMVGRLRLHLEETNVSALIREIADDLCEPAARAAALHIVIEAPAKLMAMCDRSRLEQVFMNMLSNATKYGQGKPIEVMLTCDDNHVRLSVRDHGIGIAAEDRDRIFQKFERAASEHHYGGMGLGLYISRCLAEAHGGTIEVDSTVGQGSAFTLKIPRWPTVEPAASE